MVAWGGATLVPSPIAARPRRGAFVFATRTIISPKESSKSATAGRGRHAVPLWAEGRAAARVPRDASFGGGEDAALGGRGIGRVDGAGLVDVLRGVDLVAADPTRGHPRAAKRQCDVVTADCW